MLQQEAARSVVSQPVV